MDGATLTRTPRSSRLWRRFVVSSRRANIFFLLEIAFLVAFVLMAGTTYLAFATPPADRLLPTDQVAFLLIGTLVPAMALVVLFGRRLALRRAAGSTARLHVRIVAFFSLISAIPTLLVAAFAGILFQSGIDFWFSDSSRGLMQNADQFARGFYEQNQLDVGNETVAMAGDLRFYFQSNANVALTNPNFVEFVNYQMQGRDLNEAAILQAVNDGSLRTAVTFDVAEGNEPGTDAAPAYVRLRDGEPVVVNAEAERIYAVAPIDRDSGVYLYNARNAAADSFASWKQAQQISQAYGQLTERAQTLQLRFNLALFAVSLGLVGLAVWFALRFADRQVEPLTELVTAARNVGAGNFAMRVEGRTGSDEIGMLNRAFNRMTSQLEKQNDALLGANSELEQRREFIEAVLESVTAGVVSTDVEGRVLLMNGSAQGLLLHGRDVPPEGMTVAKLAPQINAMIAGRVPSGIIGFNRGGEMLTLAVKIAPEGEGHVVTFEDITRQLVDQRQAAWSDVARRIAHEIKNPLTPIQLATERLKRRYRKQIDEDGELFDELTSTIVRQVGDLRKMVDEFSSFARLPKPNFRQEDALDLVRQAVFLQEVANQQVDFSLHTDGAEPYLIQADRHQLGQAMTNVLKNAVEAVEARSEQASDYRGAIHVDLALHPQHLAVSVTDNGVGLPAEGERIVEPYVTTREKGTGLGLAIVTKIVEEHGGDIVFASPEEGGTRVTLRFAREPRSADTHA